MNAAPEKRRWVLMGRVSGLYGVRGWLKVFSHTEPRSRILDYNPLFVNSAGQWRALDVEDGRVHGKGVIIKPAGHDDRDAASALIGCDIAVRRDQLPEPEPGEYYWADLAGLRVVTVEGVELGTVDHLFKTGANDVMVVTGERQRLIPFVRDEVIVDIDFEQGVIQVDWDPEF